jgi:hypothetical protein
VHHHRRHHDGDHRGRYDRDRAKVVTNHVTDPQSNRVRRIDPVTRASRVHGGREGLVAGPRGNAPSRAQGNNGGERGTLGKVEGPRTPTMGGFRGGKAPDGANSILQRSLERRREPAAGWRVPSSLSRSPSAENPSERRSTRAVVTRQDAPRGPGVAPIQREPLSRETLGRQGRRAPASQPAPGISRGRAGIPSAGVLPRPDRASGAGMRVRPSLDRGERYSRRDFSAVHGASSNGFSQARAGGAPPAEPRGRMGHAVQAPSSARTPSPPGLARGGGGPSNKKPSP